VYFFKNGTGWCVRHDPQAKPQAPSSKPHAPIFRKKVSSSEGSSENLRSAKLREHQAASIKP